MPVMAVVYYYKTTKIGDSMGGNCNYTVAKKLRRRRDKCAELRMTVVLTRWVGRLLRLWSLFSELWFVLILDDAAFCALIKDAFAPRLVLFFFWINYVVELLGYAVLDQL